VGVRSRGRVLVAMSEIAAVPGYPETFDAFKRMFVAEPPVTCRR
jgi:hypothetical protein